MPWKILYVKGSFSSVPVPMATGVFPMDFWSAQRGFARAPFRSSRKPTGTCPWWRLKQVLEESGKLRPDVLASFGIETAWLDRFPRELSGGELQRFCVARALMSGANFLICDEISTMLDVITQAQIWNKILEEAAAQNMGLIAVTHNRALANRVCTRVYDLSTGESWIPETQKLPGAPS